MCCIFNMDRECNLLMILSSILQYIYVDSSVCLCALSIEGNVDSISVFAWGSAWMLPQGKACEPTDVTHVQRSTKPTAGLCSTPPNSSRLQRCCLSPPGCVVQQRSMCMRALTCVCAFVHVCLGAQRVRDRAVWRGAPATPVWDKQED